MQDLGTTETLHTPATAPRPDQGQPSPYDDVSLAAGATAPNESATEGMAQAASAAATDQVDEAIRIRAFEIYEARGEEPGDAFTDWITAERQVRSGLFTNERG